MNIYGGGIHRSDQLIHILNECHARKLNVRLYGNHHLLTLDRLILNAVNELLVWCPSADPERFNFMVSEPLFSEFKDTLISQSLPNMTLVHFVRPLGFELLPEFYDLCVDMGTQGLILYLPSEFNREERRYIKRFKRVPGMRVLKQKNQTAHQCYAVPNGINGFGFELFEWQVAIRQSVKKVPIFGQLI